MNRKALERARALVELGGHPKTPKHEAEAASVAACRLIREHRLLDDHPNEPKVPERRSGTTVDGPLLVLQETTDHWRFARTRGATATQHLSWIPKTAVIRIDWIDDPAERARIPGGTSSRVARSVTIDPDWLHRTARRGRVSYEGDW